MRYARIGVGIVFFRYRLTTQWRSFSEEYVFKYHIEPGTILLIEWFSNNVNCRRQRMFSSSRKSRFFSLLLSNKFPKGSITYKKSYHSYQSHQIPEPTDANHRDRRGSGRKGKPSRSERTEQNGTARVDEREMENGGKVRSRWFAVRRGEVSPSPPAIIRSNEQTVCSAPLLLSGSLVHRFSRFRSR